MATPTAVSDRALRGAPSATARLRRVVDGLLVVSTVVLIASIPVENAVSYGGVTLSRVVAIPVIAVFAVRFALIPRLQFDRPFAVCLLAFVAWVLASYFWSYSPQKTLLYTTTYVQLALLVLVVWQFCSTRRRFRMALAALCAGGAVGSGMSFLSTTATHGGVPRYSVGDPNDFGVGLSMTLVATLYLGLTTSSLRWRLVTAVLAAVQVAAILRTASRTALVTLVIGTLIVFLDRRALRPSTLLGLAVTTAVAYAVVLRVTSAQTFERLGTIVTDTESGDLNQRGTGWAYALSYWSSSPVEGIGAGAFRIRSQEDGVGRAVHSVYVGVLSELGLVGVALFFGLVALGVWRAWTRAGGTEARVVIALVAVWAIGALTLTLEIRKMIWVVLALATSDGIARLRQTRGGDLDPAARQESRSTTG